jgi:hypothetical protein
MFPASSRLRLQTNLPLRGLCPRGTSCLGTRTKTFKSERLFISSRAPAIQYSRSGEAIALPHSGSSSRSTSDVAVPSAMAASTSSTEVSAMVCVSSGIKSCESRTGAKREMKAAEWSSLKAVRLLSLSSCLRTAAERASDRAADSLEVWARPSFLARRFVGAGMRVERRRGGGWGGGCRF